VLGLLSVPENRTNNLQEFMIVNIDKNTITLPKGFFGDIPHKRSLYPNQQTFSLQFVIGGIRSGFLKTNQTNLCP
jgi:hypothetical protein